MTVLPMPRRYFTAVFIAATVSSPYSVGVDGADGGAPVSDRRSALELAPSEDRVVAPKATPAEREENARTAPGSDVPPSRPIAVREPPPDINAPVPVTPVPSATEEVLAAMRREIDQLRFQLAQEQDRGAALETEVANEQARRSRDAEETTARHRDLTAMMSSLAEIDRRLATGFGHVSDELARAQATAAFIASSAAAAGATLQSAHASDAQSWIAASREALARSDLLHTRLAVQRAFECVRRAALAAAVPGPDARAARE
jgi:hypothetical protein